MFVFNSISDPISLIDKLEQFLEFWLGSRRPNYGEPASLLNAVRLPEPLRRLYAFAGHWPPANKTYKDLPNAFYIQDGLRPISELEIQDDGKVVFLDENQGTWVCATLPDGQDCPVWAKEEKEWNLITNSLARFLVSFCLQELLFGSRLCIDDSQLTETFETVKDSSTAMWTNGPYVLSPESHTFLLWKDSILIGQIHGCSWFAANSDKGIEFVTSLLKVPIQDRHG